MAGKSEDTLEHSAVHAGADEMYGRVQQLKEHL
jgi:hypothetical protein